MTPRAFQKRVYDYYRANARDLPWRKTRDPYRIFVSEMMLQQTAVESVIPKYERFIAAFPDFAALAKTPLRKILALWKGLGYNRRALYLQKSAKLVVNEHRGQLPRDAETLATFPGIGQATASAIAAFAFNRPVVFIETNIRRVFIHHFFSEICRTKHRRKFLVSDDELIPLVARMLDRKNPRRWYNALMDYGSMLKTRVKNPNRRSRHYIRQAAFRGSDREIRGKILELLLAKSRQTEKTLFAALASEQSRVQKCLAELRRDGLVRYSQKFFTIA